jgi:hypothetical protein
MEARRCSSCSTPLDGWMDGWMSAPTSILAAAMLSVDGRMRADIVWTGDMSRIRIGIGRELGELEMLAVLSIGAATRDASPAHA